MKRKNASFLAKANLYAKKLCPCVFAIACAMLIMINPAFAASGASDLFQLIIKILGAFAIVGGALMAFTGASAYAEAKAEGEGPAMAKAKNQLVAAVCLILIGVLAATLASTLAGYLVTSIS